MKKILDQQRVFNVALSFLAFLAQRESWNSLTRWTTNRLARINLSLKNPSVSDSTAELAKTWQRLMPADGQQYYKIKEITENTAYTEIHLHCPLRGTGNVQACYRLMNYDRQLMNKIGGVLVVLESQSNSGESFCRLAIRTKGLDMSDLTEAHEKVQL